ncbi:glycerol-3-phosphate 1-O-acyltransferase PlsY [Adhaeribacter soli]|uniref:Glycerol-3-phosphate acyltransferase n=1 Tax=Adhaeribacter soli TaxID=2607655 RepID=A0A5N1II91_9BACT|nr:glycerol-3-phosphate 1-O-acyltransferase PlsY [Adhaeribacter soli]KAA9325383.1 glycerol-3-phosphate 1-O-acyltransferase PlsY [Adhaeribacter soli]
MNLLLIGIFALAAYLIGAIPTALWVGKAYFGIDIREHGSGNSGATNTFRVLGKKPGSIVMLVDIFKGWVATSLAAFLIILHAIPVEYLVPVQLAFGFIAVLGHVFPVYAGFRGGKGVATLLGMVLAIHPEAALVCLGIFVIVLLTTKYVSLGSMLAAMVFPLLMLLPWFRPEHSAKLLTGFGIVVFILIVVTHRKNIRRLMQGNESKANIRF